MGKWRKRHYFYYNMFKWPLSELLFVLCALCTFNWFQFCTNLGPFRELFCNKSTKQKKWFYDLVKENLWNILISGTIGLKKLNKKIKNLSDALIIIIKVHTVESLFPFNALLKQFKKIVLLLLYKENLIEKFLKHPKKYI